MNQSVSGYTLGEEIANSITHGLGVILSVAGLVVLIVFAVEKGSIWHFIGFSIFGASLIILYLASTLYHSIPHTSAKKIFKIIDHSAIFLLIAGTYTPFLLISLRDTLGWCLFGIVWSIAITGIVFKSIFITKFRKISVVVYIIMGWLSIVAIKELYHAIPLIGIILLALGGFFYTMGVIFYTSKKLPYNHAIWHMFVLCGSVCHYFSVLYYL
ncbi:MAG: hemolysin III [Ignavibacteria bacterium RBG_13_36_8]|nr:MAG: hemolysin III [Ignavibacteria bacterium RBG_13_36_8]